jgi:hypothetical protein
MATPGHGRAGRRRPINGIMPRWLALTRRRDRADATTLLLLFDFSGTKPPSGTVIRMDAVLPNVSDRPSDCPAALADTETARIMIERLRAIGRRSTAEMLEELRRAFPDSPLAVRVRALAALHDR